MEEASSPENASGQREEHGGVSGAAVIELPVVAATRCSCMSCCSIFLSSLGRRARIGSALNRNEFQGFRVVRIDSRTPRIDSYPSRDEVSLSRLQGIDSHPSGIDSGPNYFKNWFLESTIWFSSEEWYPILQLRLN
ncbi:hypothetical protein PIB30_057991 [Stylosanthes scabra]|uniref:Uncharacterized protein n=1 Tax=Stylosanthes scabra TaxID=79078 RepID=A0ABU6WJP8_9FABA|nr:hypothetical protein [Stylosanthes scabra]